MVQKQATISKEPVAQRVCHHYWIIESPTGPASQGVCKFCGARKEFRNYLPDCLAVDDEEFQEWIRRQRDDKEDRKLKEGVLSWVGKGDKEAVKAGT
jgi:hypothetical protein